LTGSAPTAMMGGSIQGVSAMQTRAKSRRGFVLLAVVFLLMIFLGFLGLVVDLGYFFYVRRQMQKATDAAAIGADHAIELQQLGQMTQAGWNDASLNGFTNGQNNVTVTIHNPPTSGPYQSDTLAVEAIINQPVPTLFMKVFGWTTVPVRTRAVAHLGSATNCIYALDPSASGALTVAGTATVDATCGVIDDSSSNSALQVNGTTATLKATSVSVTGNWSGTGIVTPTPTVSQPPAPDPLAYLQPPSYSSCNYSNTSSKNPITTSTILNPGVYCGGIWVQGQAMVTFNPGLYILAGGGFNISGGATLDGSGVTFYNTGPNGSPSACGQVYIAGNTTANLAAPTTGGNYGPLDTGGILFFQDRSCSTQALIAGTSGQGYTGALYFYDANLTYAGTSQAAAYTITVANTLTFQGTPTFNDNYSGLPSGSPIRGVVLGE
jgi:Putative Flp pilus-assembly TadE/G-like